MNSGNKKSHSKIPLKAVMIYIPINDVDTVGKFARDRGISVSKIAREGILMRMDRDGDRFEQGFNEGLNVAMATVKETKGAGMMFPSGKSFAQLVCDGIEPLLRPVKHE